MMSFESFLLFLLYFLPSILAIDAVNMNVSIVEMEHWKNIDRVKGNGTFRFHPLLLVSADDNGKEPNDGKEVWKPAYEKISVQEWKKANPGSDGQQVFYFGEDGTCAVLDESGTRFVKPLMNYTSLEGVRCLHEFRRIAFGPACGDPYFSRIKYCSMVHFFNNELPEESPILTGDAIDLVLALIDGCAVCNKSTESLKMDLSLWIDWPEGSFFTGCSKKEIKIGGLENAMFGQNQFGKRTVNKLDHITDDTAGASFVVPGIFYQRICDGLFSTDAIPNFYKNIWLKVEHNCGGENKNFEIKLPKLIPKEHKLHVAEMRGLLLDLDNEEWFQFRMKKRKFGKKNKLIWGNKIQDEIN